MSKCAARRVSFNPTDLEKHKQTVVPCHHQRVKLDLVKSGLTDHETGLKIMSTVATFRDVFALNDAELGQTHLVEHQIDTADAGPIKFSPYRLASGKMAVVKQEVDDILSI